MRVTVEHSFSFIGVYSRVQVGDHRGNWKDKYQITVLNHLIYERLSIHESCNKSANPKSDYARFSKYFTLLTVFVSFFISSSQTISLFWWWAWPTPRWRPS